MVIRYQNTVGKTEKMYRRVTWSVGSRASGIGVLLTIMEKNDVATGCCGF